MNLLILDNQVVYPPEAGGPKRIFNLYSNLGKNHRVHFIGVTGYLYLNKLNKMITENFSEDTISLTKPFIILNNFFHNMVKSVPTFDIICSYFMFLTPNVARRVKNYAKTSKVLISSHPWMFSSIKKYKNKLLVYDSHNCEYMLYKKFFRNNFVNNLFCRYIFKIEREACRKSDVIFACSEADKKLFVKLYKVSPRKVFIVPNPININEITPAKNKEKEQIKQRLNLGKKKTILFIGSNFLPNVEAFNFIYNNLVPELKDCIFLIIGDISDHYYQGVDKRLRTVELKDLNIRNAGILGYGFHNVEKWGKEGFNARWTKKEFNFFIKDKNIKRIIIHVRSLKNIIGTVYINASKIKKINFRTGTHFKKFEIPVNNVDDLNCTIKLDRINKPFLFDTRAVGITIKSITYIARNKQKRIKLDKNIAPYMVPENMGLFGRVSNKKMKDIIAASDIAINPVISGSGINIKMIDYMAAGLPVVTTKIGARGFENGNEDMIVTELGNFKNNIIGLFKEKELYNMISRNARRTVIERFDAKKYGKRIAKILGNEGRK